MRGEEIVFARRPLRLDASDCAAIEKAGWCHDLPREGARLAWGDPLCSVSATGGDCKAVADELDRRREETLTWVEH